MKNNSKLANAVLQSEKFPRKLNIQNSALPMTLPNLISTIDTVHRAFQVKALQSVSINLTLRNFIIGYYIVEYEQNGNSFVKGIHIEATSFGEMEEKFNKLNLGTLIGCVVVN